MGSATYHWILATPLASPPSLTRQFKNFSANPFCNLHPFLSSSSSLYSVIIPNRSSWCTVRAQRKNPLSEPLVKPSVVDEVLLDEDSQEFDDDGVILDPSIVDEVSADDDFEEFDDDGVILYPSIVDEVSEDDDFEELDDERLIDDDDVQYEYLEEDREPSFGDGGGGGGISLAGTTWDKEALAIAEEVSLSFNGELGIYAFKTLRNSTIRVRIERLTNKSGSPSMEDIDAFSSAFRERLDEAEAAGSVPNISLEVSSPGVERIVRIPQDLERFKERNMYVKYVTLGADATSSSERDGVFRLVSFDLEQGHCTWGLANVRVNREKGGKGRPLSKKQKEWRVITPFESLILVRFFADF